jgi:cytochrome c biogenesis protein CcmG/thiol:disulfide interchange protein DsbE
MMKSLRLLVPIAIFAIISLFLYKGLDRNPRDLPSALIDKPAPAFALPVLGEETRNWSPQAYSGQVWLLNVWGSWCAACQIEHPVLEDLARSGVAPIVGLAWKDRPEASAGWLRRFGNPYSVVVSDVDGRAGIDWGVYGAPETFIIDRQGKIRFKHVGPVTPELVQTRLLPLIESLKRQS